MRGTRREFLRWSTAACVGARGIEALTGQALEAAPKLVPGADRLTAYQVGPHIWVRWANRLLTSYRAHPTQKYPYLYPLTGPLSGLSLTTETSLPYPHHRSLLFACDRVNGANFWQGGLESGQIISSGPKLGETAARSVELSDRCEWRAGSKSVVMRDRRRIVITVAHDRLRLIDFDIRWEAAQDVAVPRTNHSLFALRAAPDMTPWRGGTLLNSEGAAGEKATFGKPADWCTYFGRRRPPGSRPFADQIVEGIALFDHPENPWAPTPWFTRDYGFISPTPLYFRDTPWRLSAGQAIRLRYRVVLYAGTAEQADLPTLFQKWVNAG